jgi:quercetin dioxygenase-like cupin family protein
MNRSDLEELAALDAVGALDEDSRRVYRESIASATEDDRAAVAAIYDAATLLTTALMPVTPPPAVKERLLTRVTATAEVFSVRAAERRWQATPVAGVEVQTLHHDAARNTIALLVRLAPGAIYPAHHHSGPEECYVLTGDVSIHGERLTAGDFHHADGGTDHGTVTSERGAELLLVVAASDYHPST